MKKSYSKILAVVCLLLFSNVAKMISQTALVKDIEPGASGSMGTSYFVKMGTAAFFVAYTSANNYELWKTDATTAGTTLLKDINPGTGNANPSLMFVNGTTMYFLADNGTNGKELWKSDGTTAGTSMVKDIAAGATQGVYSYTFFASIGSTIYFIANSGTTGDELWKSDGTAGGTVLVKDINPGSGSGFSSTSYSAVVGSTLFFTATDGVNGTELWKSDGTAGGTVMVKDIYSGASSSTPQNMNVIGSTLYFTATTSANGEELWKSDGTVGGTVMVKDIYAGTSSSSPTYFCVFGTNLYFGAVDAANGREVWKSDGTTAGTVLLKDINVGSSGAYPADFVLFGSSFYFTATSAAEGEELWKSDGTTAGTTLLKDINPGTNSSGVGEPTVIGTKMYFRASTAANGSELWKTDGTTAGTALVRDITVGTTGSYPSYLANMNGALYFQASIDVAGNNLGTELFTSDGTSGGTLLVEDMRVGSSSSVPSNFLYLNSTILFSAYADTYGNELYKVTSGYHKKAYFVGSPTTVYSSSPVNFANFTDQTPNDPISWSWTFTGGTPATSTAQNPSNIVYNTPGCYQVSLTTGFASGSDNETKTCYITVIDINSAYCTVYGAPNPTYYYVDGVQLGSINNSATGAAGGPNYENYLAQSTNLTHGQNYTITITGTPYSDGTFAAWIDYNRDGVFDVPSEELGQVPEIASPGTVRTINFTVPAGGYSGTTRMRVKVADDRFGSSHQSLTPCGDWSTQDGETEDYTVVIGGGGGSPPVANFSASSTSITVGGTTNFTDLSTNAPTSWSWSFTGGSPATSTLQNPSSISYAAAGCYQVTLTATNAYGSDPEVKTCYINVTTGGGGTYCVIPTPTYGTSDGDFIDGVTLGSINNINSGSTTGPFYNDYTSMSTNIAKSSAYTVNVKSGTWLAGYPDYYAVWIDYNHDYDFLDAGEKLGEFLSTAPSTTQGIAFTVPATATTGATRMRVRGIWNTAAGVDPCIGYNYGETEDYSVNITTAGGSPPVANFSASVTSLTAGGSTNFTDLSTNTPTSWSWSFTGGTPATSTTQNPSGISYATAGCYQVSLTATNAYGSDPEVKTCYINVTAGGGGSYCVIPTPVYGTSDGDYVDGVTVGSINNINSGAVGGPFYNDYTSMSTNLVKTSSYTANIKAGAWPATYADYYAVWIDYNHNSDFTDAGEKLGEFLSSAPSTTQGIPFTVPSTAMTGATRMRVRGVWDMFGGIDPCLVYNYGETEDYTVNIVAVGTSIEEASSGLNCSVHPNPFNSSFILSSSKAEGELFIYNVIGEMVYTQKITATETEIDLSKYQNGIYFIQVQVENGLFRKKMIKQ